MSNLKDFLKDNKPKFDKNGIRIETKEEIENWRKI